MTPTPTEQQALHLVKAMKDLRTRVSPSFFSSLLRFWLMSETYIDELEKLLENDSDQTSSIL